jgi:hypothetical protein
MVRSARNTAVAVLVASVAITSPIHGSSLFSGQPAARQDTGAASWTANFGSFDWLFSLLHLTWAKTGSTLDPNGAANTSQPSTPSNGSTLDPNGSQPPSPSNGSTLDPSGSKIRRLRFTASASTHRPLPN